MPPRHAYWTILIDDKPTAFRAREREELQPTFVQLQRKNANVTMQWFARGRLWASREAERDDFQMRKQAASAPRDRRADRPQGAERRGRDWRPGGAHKDPRDRFKKKNRPERAWSEKDPATQRDRDKPGYAASRPRDQRADRPWHDKPRGDRPWGGKPGGPPRGDRPWGGKPAGPPRGDRGWAGKPGSGTARPWEASPRERKPWNTKPGAGAPPNDRPWQTKPTGPRALRKPWTGKPAGDDRRPWGGRPDRPGPPRERKPWQDKAAGGPPRRDRPWSGTPPAAGGPPWSGKPRDPNRKPFAPRGPRPGGGPPRKRRDDED